jgi:hypothetical protein
MRHVILISGKDSLATAIVQIERDPDLPYELVNNETGWDLPEVLAWIQRVAVHFGRPVIKCGDDLTEICVEQNCLPLPFRRFCTKYAKIKPLNEFLGRQPATIYFGLRADEGDRIGYDAPGYQTAKYPLREAGVDLAGVWGLVTSVNLLPPQFHWPWMEARVRSLLGSDEYLIDNLRPWKRSELFAWRSRSNCDRCFYKRLYEWIGLLEFYPDRFEDSCLLEEKLCHKPELTWLPGFRLRALAVSERAAKIKERRAKAIVKYLQDGRIQSLFDGESFTDELATTSCGLLCGK